LFASRQQSRAKARERQDQEQYMQRNTCQEAERMRTAAVQKMPCKARYLIKRKNRKSEVTRSDVTANERETDDKTPTQCMCKMGTIGQISMSGGKHRRRAKRKMMTELLGSHRTLAVNVSPSNPQHPYESKLKSLFPAAPLFELKANVFVCSSSGCAATSSSSASKYSVNILTALS